jgi:hypothetical protein
MAIITTVSFMGSISLSQANLLKEIHCNSGDFPSGPVEVSTSCLILNCNK